MAMARWVRPVAAGAVLLAGGGWLALALAGGPAVASGVATCGAGVATLTVTGSGTASAAPDQLTVNMSVDASAASAGQALSEDDSAAAAVVEAFRTGGVPPADIQTTGLSIQPNYTTQNGSVVLSGYSVDNSVVATVTRLSTAGSLIDSVASAGGNDTRIGSLSFGLRDPRQLQDRARQDAVAQAVDHAGAMAAAAGERLSGVCSITDQGSASPAPLNSGFAAQSLARVPLEAGTEQASAQVSVVYRLAPGRVAG